MPPDPTTPQSLAGSRSLCRFYDPVLDAAIAEFAFRRVVAGDRVGAAVPLGYENVRIHAGRNQCCADGIRPLLRQLHVCRRITGIVGVAGDLDHGPGRELLEGGRGMLQQRLAGRRNFRAVGRKIDD